MSIYQLEGQSDEYRKLAAELLAAEIALRDQRERVAELRRALPRGTPVEDHVLLEGSRDLAAGDTPIREVRLSQLFERPADPLVLVHFMFGGKQEHPCPMCTMWADGYDGLVGHLEQRIQFGVLVAGDLDAFRAHARTRGWRNARLLSSAHCTLKRDLGFEKEDGAQDPGVSVFVREPDGSVLHTYSSGAFLGDERFAGFRGMDLLNAAWSIFDLTPTGRGDFLPKLDYSR